MNLATELRQAGIEWSIDPVVLQEESRRHPGKFYETHLTRVRLTDWSDKGVGKGATPETLERTCRTEAGASINRLLALALRDLLPEHPVRRAYLDSMGNTPVGIKPESLNESLGEIIHVQLRKCIDSKQSAIQWNAIHHLLPDDWTHILKIIRENITDVQEKVTLAQTQGRDVNLLRRNVGLAIKAAMTERMDEICHRGVEVDFEEATGQKQNRTKLQDFALQSFESANWLTEDDEWVFGWTGYLCDEAPQFVPSSKTDGAAQPVVKKTNKANP